MSEYREVLSEDIIKENTNVYNQYVDDNHYGYHIIAKEGYVLYDPTSDMPVLDANGDETGEVIKSYSEEAYIPLRVRPDMWNWIAVPKSSAQ